MCPAPSDDKCSSQGNCTALTQGNGRSASNIPLLIASRDKVEVPKDVTTDESGEEEVGGEPEENLFLVEIIKKHVIDKDGALKFLVQWQGFESKKDWTWEPEDNLKVSGDEILDEYYSKIGGRDRIFQESEAAQTKKRRRATKETFVTTPKRSEQNEVHAANKTLLVTANQWSPPSGSWEDEIETIDACEEDNGKLVVYLIWKNGQKTKHDTQVIYRKCPQKMLQYYERHVKIIRSETARGRPKA